MDFSKDIERQKSVMGYPSMARHNQYISHQQTIPSSYNNSSFIMPSNYNNYPNNNNNSYSVNYSQKYLPLQDQIGNNINTNSTSFGRYVTTMMLILVMSMIMFSIVIWMLFGKEKPQFQIVSLQVPTGLMITSTSMLGNWQVNISMKNPNNELDIKINQGKVGIFYETNLLAENIIDPFNLGGKRSTFLFSNLTTLPMTFLEKGILLEANGSRNDSGVLRFAVQINMGYEYSSKTESKRERIRVYCNDLKVQFGHGLKDKGELIKDESVDCIGTTI
ncbi:hypothetical protein H5410_000414 [Solanum commersonii]|uniref:Late embryogenesis abundant protein LEA-2 subgroup domain-containing protein n=1 Tax=Solanum commersonii TaxID=4109 RepID=A0A9J6AWF7_SOLCO|nr:hypothetical protein H5410_000414 [Solanum commersonii]